MKALHEETGLNALGDELTGRGRQARITCGPDVDGHPVLYTDAVLEIDGRDWAVDHCLISRPADLPPAMAQAEKTLRARLEVIAERYQRGVYAAYLPQASAGRAAKDIDAYYDEAHS